MNSGKKLYLSVSVFPHAGLAIALGAVLGVAGGALCRSLLERRAACEFRRKRGAQRVALRTGFADVLFELRAVNAAEMTVGAARPPDSAPSFVKHVELFAQGVIGRDAGQLMLLPSCRREAVPTPDAARVDRITDRRAVQGARSGCAELVASDAGRIRRWRGMRLRAAMFGVTDDALQP